MIKVGVAYINVCVSRHLKEELVWVKIHGYGPLVIKCYLKHSCTAKKLKNKAVLNLKQYCKYCYMTLSNVF